MSQALTKPRGHVSKVGLHSLDRRPRGVARECRRFVEHYGNLPVSRATFPTLTA